jgi:signal transduction histidine kinase
MASEAEVLGAAHAALSARYQQLVLLNRLSAELFSGQPLAETLPAVASVVLALTGAKAACIYFVDDARKPFCAVCSADKKLKDADSMRLCDGAAAAALKSRTAAEEGSGPAWAAAPFDAEPGPDFESDGAIVLGFHGQAPADPGRERLLGEIGAVVRRARRLERDLERRRQLEKMKSELVALTSHELRTPLAAIQGFAELLIEMGDEIPSEKRREQLTVILNESKRLGRLVTNYLDLAKLEAGGSPPERGELDLAALTERLRALFKDHPSKAVLKVELAPDARVAWADEDQLYRALVNLCGNALRYSPPQGVVTIASRRVARAVELSVSDHGPGMPENVRARLFEPFYRGEDALARTTLGTGLGLAITKAIVEAHGGRIAVESKPGRGARFFFTIPDQA